MLVCLDSNVFIAALSGNETYASTAQKILLDIRSGTLTLAYSTIVFGEVLGGSNRKLDQTDINIDGFFAALANATIVPVSAEIGHQAGAFRLAAGPALKLPDALHLATALDQKVDVFITDDSGLAKISSKYITARTLREWSRKPGI